MSAPLEILLVDDDPSVRAAFSRVLAPAGYRVIACEDGIEALQAIEQRVPSLVVLDVDMPRLNGWETLAELRRRGLHMPVLMVTHANDLDSRVSGLEAGADDYIGKPCAPAELLARVRALQRRIPGAVSSAPVLRLGKVTVDLRQKSAIGPGGAIRLTRTEFALLDLLSRHPGVPVSREEIFDRVWKAKEGSSHTLDTHLWRLRKKIGDSTEPPRWIINHPGIGFALAADVAETG